MVKSNQNNSDYQYIELQAAWKCLRSTLFFFCGIEESPRFSSRSDLARQCMCGFALWPYKQPTTLQKLILACLQRLLAWPMRGSCAPAFACALLSGFLTLALWFSAALNWCRVALCSSACHDLQSVAEIFCVQVVFSALSELSTLGVEPS